jgi:hypothetical protein
MDSHSTDPSGEIVISDTVRQAVSTFRTCFAYEKELASDSVMLGHMKDFVLAQVLNYLLEGKTDDEIVRYIESAQQSFRSYRREHLGSNPVRVFRRETREVVVEPGSTRRPR